MADFPISGWWWLEQAPNQRVGGTLSQDDDGTLQLETVGGLEDEPRLGTERIFGHCLGTPVTLVDARWGGARAASSRFGEIDPDATAERWTATTGVLGKHVGHDQAFDGVQIESYWLDGWSDVEYFNTDYTKGVLLRFADAGDRTLQSAEIPDGTIVFAVGMSSQTGQRTWSFSRNTTIEVRRRPQMSLDDCVAELKHLDALTTVLFSRPTAASRVTLHSGGQRRLGGGGSRLIGEMAPPRHCEPGQRLHPPTDALCTYEQFGELGGLARWFSMDEDFRYLAGRVASHHRAEGRFVEDRALMAFSAGEALDRTETGYSRSSARTRWKRLAIGISEFVEQYLNRPVESWAHALVERRDDLSHALSLGPSSPTAGMHVEGVTASAHLLSVLTLFRLAGLGERILPMTSNRRWQDERSAFAYLTDGIDG